MKLLGLTARIRRKRKQEGPLADAPDDLVIASLSCKHLRGFQALALP